MPLSGFFSSIFPLDRQIQNAAHQLDVVIRTGRGQAFLQQVILEGLHVTAVDG
jgi:hypothetical protein